MTEFQEKYINPFTDFGFKKLFGEEANKDLLLDFLNELLQKEQGQIKSVEFSKNEHIGISNEHRRAIFDIYCTNEKGEVFIVEIQKAKHKNFKERTVFYSAFPIMEQSKQSDWDFNLKAIYTIAIMDFVFDDHRDEMVQYRHDVKLVDIRTNKVFYDKLAYFYLEMPKFNKTLDELETRFDKWMYVLKNLPRLDRVPDKLKEKIFSKVFDVAEIAKFSSEQRSTYEESLKIYRDLKGVLDTSKEEGRIEGIQEGIEKGIKKGRKEGEKIGAKKEKYQIAKNLLDENMPIDFIKKITGISDEEIDGLK